ncbi:hypothetical protein NP572_05705 [Pseudomonas putida]|uniref:hypothetical protein n=1 Tax=Pseudomonas putida TaxID=303 RepID=UPI0023633077|nr:hypothetical protein [Pseudomonas putida]MDD2035912.1 hypothetical protein [Pseudomonas putida]MDD2041633.1 hypothetical protein [Pseudomonas putida]
MRNPARQPYLPGMATNEFIEQISAVFIFTVNYSPVLEVRMRNGDVFEEAGSWDHVSTVHRDLIRCSSLVLILPRTRLAVNPADIESLTLELAGGLPVLVVAMADDTRYRVRADYEPEGAKGVYHSIGALLEALE